MDPLQVTLLGGFGVEQSGVPLPTIASRAARSLFAYLALGRGRHFPREVLCSLFWPDATDARARRRLSHCLWQIRDALGEATSPADPILVTNDAVAINPQVVHWLDVAEFDRLLQPHSATPLRLRVSDVSALRAAVALYRGDLMEGFYDTWIVSEQERLRGMYLTGLAQLVEITKHHGAHDEALLYARRIVQADPLREDAHREVMRLCHLLGRDHDARRQYQHCVDVLRDELGGRPSPRTTALLERILDREQSPEPGWRLDGDRRQPVDTVPLVGREQERITVIDHLDGALAGHGAVVLLEAEAGVGKTRFAHQVADDAAWRGFDVLWGTAREQAHGSPFQPFAEAINADEPLDPRWFVDQPSAGSFLSTEWSDRARPMSPLRRGRRVQGRERVTTVGSSMHDVLIGLLRERATARPILLVIDDAHWADDDSVSMIPALGRALRSMRVVVLITYRGSAARSRPGLWGALLALDRDVGPHRIRLGQLTPAESLELARRAGGDVQLSARDWLHQETGGNALLVLETVRLLDAEDRADATGSSTVAGERIRRVLLSSVRGLDADERAALTVAALATEPMTLAAIADCIDRSDATATHAVSALMEAGLLTATTPGFRVTHNLLRRLVTSETDAADLVAVHDRIAGWLEQTTPDRVDLIAHHYLEGGHTDLAAHHLKVLGDRALSLHAFGTAARHYRQAARSSPSSLSAEQQIALLMNLEYALEILGERREQLAVLDRLSDLVASTPSQRAEVLRRRALALANTDEFARALATAREAVALAAGTDPSLEADTQTALGNILAWSGEVADAVDELRIGVEVAEADTVAAAEANLALGHALSQLQRYDQARTVLEAARDLMSRTGDPRGEAEALGLMGVLSMEQSRTDQARAHYESALDRCQAIGYRHGEGVNLVNLANLAYFEGNIAEALGLYESAMDVFRLEGNRRGQAITTVNLSEVHHRVLGDDGTAEREAGAALAYFRSIGDSRWEALCLETMGEVQTRRGDHERARLYLSDALERAIEARDHWWQVQIRGSIALLDLACDRPGEALDQVDRSLQMCEDLSLEGLAVGHLALRGEALLARGEVDAALVATAAATARVRPGTPGAHLVVHRRARALQAAGDRAGAARAAVAAHEQLQMLLRDLPDVVRGRALRIVPEHRRITEAYEWARPRRRVVSLTRAGVPTGRPVRPEEQVEVTLTVHDPSEDIEDIDGRRRRLARLLDEAARQQAEPTVEDLAGLLQVSRSTVRRDLGALRVGGGQVRTRGSRPTGPEVTRTE